MLRFLHLTFVLCLAQLSFGSYEDFARRNFLGIHIGCHKDSDQYQATDQSLNALRLTTQFTVGKTQFSVYKDDKLSWCAARRHCFALGDSRLAVLNSGRLLKLTTEALESAGIFEDLWTGASQQGSGWYWEVEDDPEEKDMNEMYDMKFPEWAQPNDDLVKDCLNIKPRDETNIAHLKPSDCSRRQGFICAKRIIETTVAPPSTTLPAPTELPMEEPITPFNHFAHPRFKYERNEFTFFLDYKVTWKRAQELCPQLVPGSILAELPRRELTQFMSYTVWAHPTLLNYTYNLWLGGTFDGTDWYWEEEDVPIPCYTANDGYPPWHPDLSEFYMTCLAMAGTPSPVRMCSYYLMGRSCLEKNGFVCMRTVPGDEDDGQVDELIHENMKEILDDWMATTLNEVHERVKRFG